MRRALALAAAAVAVGVLGGCAHDAAPPPTLSYSRTTWDDHLASVAGNYSSGMAVTWQELFEQDAARRDLPGDMNSYDAVALGKQVCASFADGMRRSDVLAALRAHPMSGEQAEAMVALSTANICAKYY